MKRRVIAHPLPPLPIRREGVPYSTRNLYVDYRDRLRVIAVFRDITMELVLNLALGIGLDELEQEQRAALGKAKRQ